MAAQLPDWIIINGEFKDLYSNPLESYWTRNNRRPAFIPLPNCTRGYVATWEIIDNQLFLIGIDGDYERRSILFQKKPTRFTLKTLMPSQAIRQHVKASWFSGKLRIPDGRMTRYEHHGYDSRFEKELILTIDKGDMMKMVTLNYKEKTLLLNSEILVNYKGQSYT